MTDWEKWFVLAYTLNAVLAIGALMYVADKSE